MARPPRIPVWLPLDQPVIYFITLCTLDRQPVLANQAAFHAIKAFCGQFPGWKVYCAVVMPDHLHALIAPRDREAKITQFTAALKRTVGRHTNAEWKWQKGVFDRLLRKEEKAQDKWEYMRNNPVRAGLAQHDSDWPYWFEDFGEL